jgi:nucleolar protein 56
MVVHVAECVLGVFAFNEDRKMLGSEPFPSDPIQIAGRLASIQMGTVTEEHRKLIAKFIDEGHREFSLESEELAARLKKEFKRASFEAMMPNKAGEVLRSSLREIAEQMGIGDVKELVRNVNALLTRKGLREEAAQRDRLIVQSINMLDEIDKSANTISGHIREWYSIHFPELDRLVPDHQTYLKLVLDLGTRDKFAPPAIKTAVEQLPDEEIEKIAHAAQSSLGAPFDELDVKAIRDCAEEVFTMYEVRGEISGYIDGLMAQVAPNIKAVVGGAIGARLISLAGGLAHLARLPASTIQVLGAEKALFRALRSHAKPPKHGVIYQYPDIRGSPKLQRGRIARALAGKITIAARVDAMSGEFVGERLAEDFKSRVAEIKSRLERSGSRIHEGDRARRI